VIAVSATRGGVITFLLTLPLLLYFVFGAVRQKVKNRLFRLKYSNQLAQALSFASNFSLARFFFQPSFAFRISLVLLLFTILTTLARIHA